MRVPKVKGRCPDCGRTDTPAGCPRLSMFRPSSRRNGLPASGSRRGALSEDITHATPPPSAREVLIALSLLLSATALTAARVSAANRDARDVVDGLPTADACANLGFPQQRADEECRRRGAAASAVVLRKLLAPTLQPGGGAAAFAVCRTSDGDRRHRRRHRRRDGRTARRHRELSRRHPQPDQAGRRRPGLDLLDRRRHRLLCQCPPLPQRRPPAAARRGAGRGAGQLFRLRLRAADRSATRRSRSTRRSPRRRGRRARRSSISASRATTSRRGRAAAAQPRLPDGRVRLDGRADQAAAGPEGAERADRPAAARGPGVDRRSMPARPARCSSRRPATRS